MSWKQHNMNNPEFRTVPDIIHLTPLRGELNSRSDQCQRRSKDGQEQLKDNGLYMAASSILITSIYMYIQDNSSNFK